jgi:hypothetical protein
MFMSTPGFAPCHKSQHTACTPAANTPLTFQDLNLPYRLLTLLLLLLMLQVLPKPLTRSLSHSL